MAIVLAAIRLRTKTTEMEMKKCADLDLLATADLHNLPLTSTGI